MLLETLFTLTLTHTGMLNMVYYKLPMGEHLHLTNLYYLCMDVYPKGEIKLYVIFHKQNFEVSFAHHCFTRLDMKTTADAAQDENKNETNGQYLDRFKISEYKLLWLFICLQQNSEHMGGSVDRCQFSSYSAK